MIVYHHIKQLMVQEYFSKRSDFPGKEQKLDFFCFHRVTKTHQDKIVVNYKSVCCRVAKTLGLTPALASNNCPCQRFESRRCSIHPYFFL